MFQNTKYMQKLNNYNTGVITYTQRLKIMMRLNQLYIIQVRVPKLNQNVALNIDTKYGWKQYKGERSIRRSLTFEPGGKKTTTSL